MKKIPTFPTDDSQLLLEDRSRTRTTLFTFRRSE